ncbi:MAG TPA: Gfo/Idh/MocA family oxidoreductase [Gammaproteobacteria bacterium]|nr:Gfo/Idh/MocA family oxidoreductase [Gammaproteobacteria bacterium]
MTIRCAVIGVGYLGKFHAQKYAALEQAELVAVADPDPEARHALAAELGCRAVADYRELLGDIDACSIVAPTTLHHRIASDCLEQGVHVLVEKPITTTLDEADELIALARANERVLQVGHLERFNAAVLALGDRVRGETLFIESHRLAPFKPRATDVNVVLDLMIHDIDIILDFVKSEISEIRASGASVLSDSIDIANARLEFANGCVANVTASRVSQKSERKMRLFQRDSYIGIDFQDKTAELYRKGDGEMFPGVPAIDRETLAGGDSDALLDEIREFLRAIETGSAPAVSGEDGRRALAAAMEITRLLRGGPAL